MVVAIYKPGTLWMVGVCDGPDASGHCPRMRDGQAFCAGCDLSLSKDEEIARSYGVTAWRFRVFDRATECPLATPGIGLRFAERGYFSPFSTRSQLQYE